LKTGAGKVVIFEDMIQAVLTPAAGKRLIARALAHHPEIRRTVTFGTVVIVAGTTNAYVAEELLGSIGQSEGFDRARFFRGVTLPPVKQPHPGAPVLTEQPFIGDVVIRQGYWLKGKTLFDVVEELKGGDLILKGANAIDLSTREAGVLIAHPKGGTTMAVIQAAIGRRVRVIIPVGLEKRVCGRIWEIAAIMNDPQAEGLRLCPLPGEVFTELEAIKVLTGAEAHLVAGGGIGGAEGAVWLVIRGTQDQEENVRLLLESIKREPPFEV
jgi:hypothetical protein